MAWRPNEYLIEGILDNTENGKVTGWLKFAGMDSEVKLELAGNFHRDIRGAKVRLCGNGNSADIDDAKKYLKRFSDSHRGKVGDMTAGKEPVDYVDYPYFEWYDQENGRCVLELDYDQVEILTSPIPAMESEPISRKLQAHNMASYLSEVAGSLGIETEMVISTGFTDAVEKEKRIIKNDKIRGMALLPDEIRSILPPLYAQDGKGGDSVVYVKFFTPDANWTWYATEGEPLLDEKGSEVDFGFFGMVDGLVKELGYFNLSQIACLKGSLGLPVERDLYFTPKTLKEIAPELFRKETSQ